MQLGGEEEGTSAGAKIGAAIVIVAVLAGGGYWWMHKSKSGATQEATQDAASDSAQFQATGPQAQTKVEGWSPPGGAAKKGAAGEAAAEHSTFGKLAAWFKGLGGAKSADASKSGSEPQQQASASSDSSPMMGSGPCGLEGQPACAPSDGASTTPTPPPAPASTPEASSSPAAAPAAGANEVASNNSSNNAESASSSAAPAAESAPAESAPAQAAPAEAAPAEAAAPSESSSTAESSAPAASDSMASTAGESPAPASPAKASTAKAGSSAPASASAGPWWADSKGAFKVNAIGPGSGNTGLVVVFSKNVGDPAAAAKMLKLSHNGAAVQGTWLSFNDGHMLGMNGLKPGSYQLAIDGQLKSADGEALGKTLHGPVLVW